MNLEQNVHTNRQDGPHQSNWRPHNKASQTDCYPFSLQYLLTFSLSLSLSTPVPTHISIHPRLQWPWQPVIAPWLTFHLSPKLPFPINKSLIGCLLQSAMAMALVVCSAWQEEIQESGSKFMLSLETRALAMCLM